MHSCALLAGKARSLTWSQDPKQQSPEPVQVWDLARGFCQRSLVCHSSVNSVRVSLDGSMAVSGHFDGTLRFWDLRAGKVANEVAGLHTQQITSVAVGLAAGAPGPPGLGSGFVACHSHCAHPSCHASCFCTSKFAAAYRPLLDRTCSVCIQGAHTTPSH